MNKLFFLALTMMFVVSRGQRDTISVSNGTLLENISIISANDMGEINQYTANLLIDETEIVFLGVDIPKIQGMYKILNGSGKFVIPGLIDSHVHLNNIAGLNFRQRRSKTALVQDYFRRLPKNFLYYGYTTVIDVDNYAPNVIDQLKSAPIRPEIYSCGRKIKVMDDFEMVMDEYSPLERYQSPFLHDKYNKNVVYPDSIDLKEHTPKVLVSKIAESGNICVKVLYEDNSSGLNQVWEVPSQRIMSDVVAEAHTLGLPVVLHAPSFQGHKLAVATQVDIIAHAMWNWTSDPKSYLSTLLPQTHKNVLLEIADKQIGYQPTFRTILGELDVFNKNFIFGSPFKKLYSSAYLEYLASEDAQWIKKRMEARPEFLERTNPEFYLPIRNNFSSNKEMFDEVYKSLVLKIQTVVRFLSEHDANLLFGTDTGAMNLYTHPAGLNGFLEMQHWTNAGVPLKQLFKAATYSNAKAFGLLHSMGTIHKGKKANLVILNANPLKTVDAYDAIDYVIIQGNPIQRNDLSVLSTEH